MKNENIIFGIRAVIEAIHSEAKIDKVFIQKEAQGNLMKELFGVLKANNINFNYVPVEKLNRYTQNNHQGVVATIAPIKFYGIEELLEEVSAKRNKPLFLFLAGISNGRSFGSIIRDGEVRGVSEIIISTTGAASVKRDTVKPTAGAVLNVRICKVD